MLEAKNLNKEISIKKIDNETSSIKIFLIIIFYLKLLVNLTKI